MDSNHFHYQHHTWQCLAPHTYNFNINSVFCSESLMETKVYRKLKPTKGAPQHLLTFHAARCFNDDGGKCWNWTNLSAVTARRNNHYTNKPIFLKKFFNGTVVGLEPISSVLETEILTNWTIPAYIPVNGWSVHLNGITAYQALPLF